MKYERLTEKNNALGIVINKKVITLQGLLDLLFDLEDKIERGELISTVQDERSEQEIAFFVKHNAEVRKQAVKEFAERVKMAFYYEFDELIPSIMADKIDELAKEVCGE